MYAYLKRLGFILTRAEPPTPEYPVAPQVSLPATQPQTVSRRITGLFSRLLLKVTSVARLFNRIDWWRRLQLHRQTTIRVSFTCTLPSMLTLHPSIRGYIQGDTIHTLWSYHSFVSSSSKIQTPPEIIRTVFVQDLLPRIQAFHTIPQDCTSCT